MRLRFSTTEAAKYAGCHRDTILKALESGALHGGQRVKNGRWSIRLICLESWLDGVPCEHQREDAA